VSDDGNMVYIGTETGTYALDRWLAMKVLLLTCSAVLLGCDVTEHR
jgi:hypothetical protein